MEKNVDMSRVVFDSAIAFWQTLAAMAPYLLLGFLIAGLLSIWVSPELVERHLGGRGFWQVFKAAAVGVPLPLCSCGVIPVAASLRRHGAGKGATTSFLISTPQTGVDSILVTWSLLGPLYAVLRPFAAFVSGIIGGLMVDIFDSDRTPAADVDATAKCEAECCADGNAGTRPAWIRALHYGFVVLPADLARSMVIGLIVAGLISALVPDDFFTGTLVTGIVGMFIMMAVGIPLYVCATASVPIAASLVMKGVSPGAALVFLMTGPATNGATIAVVWKTLGRRAAFIYLAVVGLTALAFGLLLDMLIASVAVTHVHGMHHEMISPAVENVCAVILLVVLAWSLIRRQRPVMVAAAAPGATTVTLKVRGMTCSHCGANVTGVLRACPGVASVVVDVPAGLAVITGTSLDSAVLVQAVKDAGYKASHQDG